MRRRMTSSWVLVLMLGLGLGIGHEARAGGKVDWSQYLEPPGARAKPVASQPAKPAATPKKAVAKSVTKKQTAESRTKTKPPARSKRK